MDLTALEFINEEPMVIRVGLPHDYTPGLDEITGVMGYLLLFIVFAVFFQFWIYKKPDTVFAKAIKYVLYLFGIALLLYFLPQMHAWSDDPGYYFFAALSAFFYGIIFCSYILTTHHIYKYKGITRRLFLKILIALIAFQILVPLEMKVQLFNI